MNSKQIIGFIIMGVIAILAIKLLPSILGIAFNLIGLLITIAVAAVIGYAFYLFFVKGKKG